MKQKRTWPWTRPDPRRGERAELEQELARTQRQITQAYAGFNTVTEPELVEFYIYEIQALQARYSFLLRRRKGLEAPAPAQAVLPTVPTVPAPADRVDPSLTVLPLRPARPVA